MSGADPAGETAMLKRMVEVEAGIVRRSVSDPFVVVGMNVWNTWVPCGLCMRGGLCMPGRRGVRRTSAHRGGAVSGDVTTADLLFRLSKYGNGEDQRNESGK